MFKFERYMVLLIVFITFIWRFPFPDIVLFFHDLQMYGKQVFDLQSLYAKWSLFIFSVDNNLDINLFLMLSKSAHRPDSTISSM